MSSLANLKAPKGATTARKRLGRGQGSGTGKTAGKGHKGQNARSGGGVRVGFEGGQMPLHMRLPKRGFTNIHSRSVEIVNMHSLERVFNDGDVVDIQSMFEKGLIGARVNEKDGVKVYTAKADAVKVLGQGQLSKKLTVKAHRISKSAQEKIEAAGGSVELLG